MEYGTRTVGFAGTVVDLGRCSGGWWLHRKLPFVFTDAAEVFRRKTS